MVKELGPQGKNSAQLCTLSLRHPDQDSYSDTVLSMWNNICKTEKKGYLLMLEIKRIAISTKSPVKILVTFKGKGKPIFPMYPLISVFSSN